MNVKIKYLATGVEEHVSNEIGNFAVKAGIAEQVFPDWKPLPVPQMYWAVRDGARVGDYLYAPSIQVKCPGCGQHTWHSSDKGTAHLTLEFRHLGGCNAMGVPEQVPAHIAEEYVKRWTAYAALSKKGKPAAPPAITKNNSVPGSGTTVQVVKTTFVVPKG
jgi:hypothetical protein